MVCGATSHIYFQKYLGSFLDSLGHLFVSSQKDYRFFPYFVLCIVFFSSKTKTFFIMIFLNFSYENFEVFSIFKCGKFYELSFCY